MVLVGSFLTDVAIRVNLSSSETFADLVVALGKSLMSARNHGHFPFSTVADEVHYYAYRQECMMTSFNCRAFFFYFPCRLG